MHGGGVGFFDSNSVARPNTQRMDEESRTTGLAATRSAIEFAQQTYPAHDTFLNGGSAGSAGTFHVAWSMQAQGIAPTGLSRTPVC